MATHSFSTTRDASEETVVLVCIFYVYGYNIYDGSYDWWTMFVSIIVRVVNSFF